ncbi:ATP phosphoribosyltransferase regulatory subunit [Spongorhabdus nitratireducens]
MMTMADRWLLPDGIEEVLPPGAWQIEDLRRQLLDLYCSWGYELVIPPQIQYLESLAAGVGQDLTLQTFKLTDQLTGRTMGLVADTTPAVARIDAHTLGAEGPSRLCYAGRVFHTRPANPGASRTPIQVGAELYGHAGIESDIEVISLMLETLISSGVNNITLDLGHVDIFRQLTLAAGLDEEQQDELFEALQRKSATEVDAFVSHHVQEAVLAHMLRELPELAGDETVLDRATGILAAAPEPVRVALENLKALSERIKAAYPEVNCYFDLGELRGYNYHTGVVFAAYVPQLGQAVAKGGRYDGIGEVFGRARPATGFSTDLGLLLQLVGPAEKKTGKILAPADAPMAEVRKLRNAGEQVVQVLPGMMQEPIAAGCDRILQQTSAGWVISSLTDS